MHRTCCGRKVEISKLLGLSVLEAMASGTPWCAVELAGCGGPGQSYRVSHRPDDVEELHDRIATVLTDARLAA